MNALTIYSPAEITPAAAQDLPAELFAQFVQWIDRSANTARAYIINLRQFIAWMRYTDTRRPARQDIISYREWLTAEHDAIQLDPDSLTGWKYRTDRAGNPVRINCKPNTIAQYLRSVCAFFRWTAANGFYPDVAANIHAPKIRNDKTTGHRKEALTPADVLTIEKSIASAAADRLTAAEGSRKDTAGRMQRSTEQGKRLFAMYLLAVNAGLRTVEISRANIRDIEVKGGKATLFIWGKGHTEPDQRKPLAPAVYEALRDYISSRSDSPTGASPLFVSTGNRSKGKRIAPTTISTMLKGAMQEAGFDSERITAHSLRHTAGTAVMELTGDLYKTQNYMRHSNPATTEIYLHTDTEKAEAGIAQQLYNLYHGQQDGGDQREKLEAALQKLTPQQLEQLTAIAAAMA